ncbi:Global transcription regulator sge1 [Dictyocoela roeselum]|nr:Global transcription regulator sge1 [Dictyocoela roeselum]
MVKGYINSYTEAALFMHAVRMNLIRPVEQRLTDEERNNIDSGSIFCFIEKEGGIKRWTDGRIWSPSKILGHFLLYKEVPRHLSKSAIKNKTVEERKDSIFSTVDKHALYKKTISISHQSKVYHIVSYFRPIFNNHGLLDYPFFKHLNKAVVENKDLANDCFLESIMGSEPRWIEKFSILPPESQYMRSNIDRKGLERVSCFILSTRFDSCWPQQRK